MSHPYIYMYVVFPTFFNETPLKLNRYKQTNSE